MGRGRLRLSGEDVRNEVEEVLFLLADLRRDLREAGLRIRQAQQRSAVVRDVLEPAGELVRGMEAALDRRFERLGVVWRDGQRRNWRDDVSE